MDKPGRWVLLVEDDKIFSTLFARAWRAARPDVAVVVAESLQAMDIALRQSESLPLLVVMDRTLPDGDGHLAARSLTCRVHLWSAADQGAPGTKPQGKGPLEEAVHRLSELARLEE